MVLRLETLRSIFFCSNKDEDSALANEDLTWLPMRNTVVSLGETRARSWGFTNVQIGEPMRGMLTIDASNAEHWQQGRAG